MKNDIHCKNNLAFWRYFLNLLIHNFAKYDIIYIVTANLLIESIGGLNESYYILFNDSKNCNIKYIEFICKHIIRIWIVEIKFNTYFKNFSQIQ